jgi:hypothetical protein
MEIDKTMDQADQLRNGDKVRLPGDLSFRVTGWFMLCWALGWLFMTVLLVIFPTSDSNYLIPLLPNLAIVAFMGALGVDIVVGGWHRAVQVTDEGLRCWNWRGKEDWFGWDSVQRIASLDYDSSGYHVIVLCCSGNCSTRTARIAFMYLRDSSDLKSTKSVLLDIIIANCHLANQGVRRVGTFTRGAVWVREHDLEQN